MPSHITSCLIVKNEESNIERLIKELSQFSEEIHIVDTGSTDHTLEKITKLSNEQYKDILSVSVFKWTNNFSEARNFSFKGFNSKYNSSNDYYFWCDADDILPPELISTINSLKERSFEYKSQIMLNYQYPNGKFVNLRNSIIRKEDFIEWTGIVHECPNFLENGGTLILEPDKGYIKHNKDFNKDPYRNVRIYNSKFVQDRCTYNSFGLRDLFFYGYELYQYESYDEMENVFKKLFEKYSNEVNSHYNYNLYYLSSAIACLAKVYIDKKHDLEKGYEWISQIHKYSSEIRADIGFYLARYFKEKNWDHKAIHWYEYVSSYYGKNLIDNTFSHEEECQRIALEELIILYNKIGNDEMSYNAYDRLAKRFPESKMIELNREWFASIGYGEDNAEFIKKIMI